MSERHADESIQRKDTIKRRGILAAAGAVVAGIVAKQTAQPVAAALNADVDQATAGNTNIHGPGGVAPWESFVQAVLSANNTSTSTGALDPTGIAGFGNVYGVYGKSPAFGVVGNSDNNYGVFGSTSSNVLNAAGVRGTAGIGVTNGVWGENFSTAFNATGVFGLASSKPTDGPTVGVWGRSESTHTGCIGVYGEAAAQAAFGVQGRATGAGGFGVYGSSAGGPGVFGTTTAAQNAGLAGLVSTPGTAAFAGTSTVPTAFAGFFTGDVFVNGNFTVNDPTKKHGAIQHPDGSHRILYSMESPESWVEDFGTGQLVNGKADVRLDPDFAAVVHTEDYHVFLTMYDSAQVLYVTNRTAGGFVVQAAQAGSSGTFSWRVVAKPKSEHKAARLAKFTIPTITMPDVASLAQAAPSKPSAGPPDPAPPRQRQPPQPQPAPPARPVSPAAAGPASGGTTQGAATNPVQPAPQPRP